MRTDGSLAVAQLKDCQNALFARADDESAVASRPHSKFARYLRMQILSFRSDLIRGNILYGAFDLTRMVIRARRNHAEKMAMARRTEPEPAAQPSMSVAALNWSFDGF